jgi:GMP synthase-like glutamine amidotransferase
MLAFIQNDPEVPAGNFAGWLREDNIPYRIYRAFAGERLPLEGVCASIILGGAMGVFDDQEYPFLRAVKGYIRELMVREIPVLGICLGGQLLADALGARVYSGRDGEKGIHPVSLTDSAASDRFFSGIPTSFPTFQWHNDSFDSPDGAVLLASSHHAKNQAFRYGGHIYGIQFHPEVDQETVAAWVHVSDEDPSKEIIDGFSLEAVKFTTVSRMLLNNFLRIACLMD